MNSTRLKGILLVLNILAGMAVAGTLIYTKLIFKRPPITESQERKKIEETKTTLIAGEQRILIKFDKMQINLKPQMAAQKVAPSPIPAHVPGSPAHTNVPSGPMIIRFLSVQFALEIRNESFASLVESKKTFITDLMISALGQKDYYEITTVQGRYVLRSQLVEAINDLLAGKKQGSGFKKDTTRSEIIATNIYFTDFTAQ